MSAPMIAMWRSNSKKNWSCLKRLISQMSCRRYCNRNILILHERGIFQNIFPAERSPDLHSLLVKSPQTIYAGFDPTSDSLHIGNLLVIMSLIHCQRAGHTPLALVGGATAMIGDPSGKTKDRRAMNIDELAENSSGIQSTLQRIFKHHSDIMWRKDLPAPVVLNNAEWYSSTNVIEFLSNVGRNFRMGDMLRKDSVKSRLDTAEGMSLTEFTYQVFQANDWLHLYNNYKCKIQIGGNDQLGNITAGYELIKRVKNESVFGLTVPLIVTSSGEKFGKTAGNAIWLDRSKTSIFDFYQYFINTPDSDVAARLKSFTFLPENEIKDVLDRHKKSPESRIAQKKLAEQVTILVHSDEGLQSAKRCTHVLYNSSPESLAELTEAEIEDVFKGATKMELLLQPGMTLIDVVMKAKILGRAREVDAIQVINGGGLYVNFRRITNPDAAFIPGEHILHAGFTVIRAGKKRVFLIQWIR
ncbi:tyrosine--tRNA ligase, mitochondrial-like [Lineus longissimus]|uniref:tyrosine--tRNA ligase, mitochondrial-like n=1 Tax=Lineus longissimus TaxID=88925 RepID=UPI002B4F3D3A